MGIPKEAEAGLAVSEICRKSGISDQTYYNSARRNMGDERQRRKEAEAGWMMKT